MWNIETVVEKPNQIWKHRLRDHDRTLSIEQVIQLWQFDSEFNDWYIDQLLQNDSRAVRWETPVLTHSNRGRDFEYVIVNSPGLARPANSDAFAEKMAEAPARSVLAFENLGRNAQLIVPTPDGEDRDFCHLLGFLRTASRKQAIQLWHRVGEETEKRLSERPAWLSTAGGGVPWLHVRLDDRPKYYSYSKYREESR